VAETLIQLGVSPGFSFCVPEMAAFGERFGFQFAAHAIGNANRSARVERPFHFIEHNFLAGVVR
jgi:hypothetical protein